MSDSNILIEDSEEGTLIDFGVSTAPTKRFEVVPGDSPQVERLRIGDGFTARAHSIRTRPIVEPAYAPDASSALAIGPRGLGAVITALAAACGALGFTFWRKR